MNHYDPSASNLRQAGSLVVTVRDPDADNYYAAWTRGAGPVYVHDMDLGRSDLSDAEELGEWQAAHEEVAVALEVAGWPEAAAYIRDVCAGVKERF